MTKTIRKIDVGPKATIALPAFAGTGVAERSVSKLCNADLGANSRAPPFAGALAARSGIQN